ncbi:MAG: His/Gly/Thr/Pro-type tRNA ligase C-terminal domain-containing protein [Bacteroidota bacterium]|nr:His/Gly/Thr/Pro-type tRNA ligase C-terminal domain-containing protein [Bacteroidota bacterium]
MFVIGEKEVQEGKVALRKQAKGDLGTKTISEALEFLKEEIDSKRAFE